jgi:hypothetical protein
MPYSLDEVTGNALAAIQWMHDTLPSVVSSAAKLAAHVATRGAAERDAVVVVMGMPQPGTDKPWSVSAANNNLDLDPAFTAWRETRNALDTIHLDWQMRFTTATREADFWTALLRTLTPPLG